MSKTSVTNLGGLVLGCVEADVCKGNTPAAAFFRHLQELRNFFAISPNAKISFNNS